MGTELRLTLEGRERALLLEASERAASEISRVEALLSTWRRGGELDSVNRAPVGRAVELSPEMRELLGRAFELRNSTSGAFEPAVAPLVRAWDLRGPGRIPEPAELRAAASDSSLPRAFRLDADGIVRLRGTAAFDEGAWGKGYALDRAAEVLRAAGVPSALLDLGGQVLAVGPRADGTPWLVDVADPLDRSRVAQRVALTVGSLSTSGNSERGLLVNGSRVGHLLDPRTGAPAADFGSVTVLAPSALAADALSTALFVVGPDAGPRLSASLADFPHEFLYLCAASPAVQRRSAGFPGTTPDRPSGDSR